MTAELNTSPDSLEVPGYVPCNVFQLSLRFFLITFLVSAFLHLHFSVTFSVIAAVVPTSEVTVLVWGQVIDQEIPLEGSVFVLHLAQRLVQLA